MSNKPQSRVLMRNTAESAGQGADMAFREEGYRLWHHAEPITHPQGSSCLASLAAVQVLQNSVSPTLQLLLETSPLQFRVRLESFDDLQPPSTAGFAV